MEKEKTLYHVVENSEIKTVVKEVFHSHCSSSLFLLNFRLLEHLVHDLDRFRSQSYTDAERLLNILMCFVNRSYKIGAR